MANEISTMTWAEDVANTLSKLANNPAAKREIFNVCGGESLSWKGALRIYVKALERNLNKEVKICYVDNAEKIARELNRYTQYKYVRVNNRVFSRKKLDCFIAPIEYHSVEEGLNQCVDRILEMGAVIHPKFRTAAYLDHLSHEFTGIRNFRTIKQKLRYCLCRFGLY